jgi:hypothetical protein
MSQPTKVLLMLDGVGALGLLPLAMKMAVEQNRLPYEVRNYVWTHGKGRMLADLRDSDHIKLKGEELATIVNGLIADDREPIVIAKSGGTAVALDALSRLATDAVEQAILLSPAVSPQYDLTMPLNAVRRKMYSFNSKYDLFFLALGTSLFGTPDGIKTKAAGCVGFHGASEYAKLHEILWTPEMITTLHFGEHFGTSMLPWLVKYVLPLLEENVEPGVAKQRFADA